MSKLKLIGFDLETPQDEPALGLQPWRASNGEASIKSAALWDIGSLVRCTKKMPSTMTLRRMLNMIAANDYTMTGWNLTFDYAWLCALGLYPELKKVKTLDAMLLLKRVDAWRSKEFGGQGYGLKAAVAENWPAYADYSIGDEVVKVPDTPEKWGALLRYNLNDAMFSAMLASKYLKRLTKDEKKAAMIESASIADVANSYIQGIAINTTALEPFEASVDETREAAMTALQIDPAVVRSPKKLAVLLYDTWGLPIIKESAKTGSPATDKETLLKLALLNDEDKRFKYLLDLRKCNTRQSKFIDAVRKSIDYHGECITRPQPNIAGTITGRFTYSSTQGRGKGILQTGIALHQWERGPDSRSLLTAPEGFLLAEFDWSGQEMRLMAIASEDDVMLELFALGKDGHAYMGSSIENMDYEWVRDEADNDPRAKEVRNLGKFCVAEGQLVLTRRGLVPIERVQCVDQVWDGVEWVSHTGVIYQGEQDVIEYQGIRLTPDHVVWCDGQHEPQPFFQAASQGLQLTRTGDGRREIRALDSAVDRSGQKRGTARVGVHSCPMRRLQDEALRAGIEYDRWYLDVLQKMQSTLPQEGQSRPIRTVKTYDVTNAGPRRRYTVSNVLISNSNLSLQYRIGVDSIMNRALTGYGLQLPRAKATHIKNTYLKTYRGVPKFWKTAVRLARTNGYATSFGHRRIVLNNLDKYEQQQNAINHVIQGTGGDMKALGLAVCKPYFNDHFRYAWDLHDALFTYVRDDANAVKRVRMIKHLLSNLPYEKAWGWKPQIPLPVDAKIGKTWGSLKTV